MAGIIEQFLDDCGLDRSKLLGVGVTNPGLISPDGSRITCGNDLPVMVV